MNAMDITWEDIFEEPWVTAVFGSRGSGKTALSHRLLEVFNNEDRDAYIMNFPEHKQDLLPDWLEVLPAGTPMAAWPENSVVLIHEAHHLIHARRSMNAENLELDRLVSVSRHKNSNIIYETQMSNRLDRNAVAAVDGILVRWPALMQEDFERQAVKPIIKDARAVLEKYVTVHDEDDFTFVERQENDDGTDLLKRHVYVHADQFRGEYPREVQLPDHWKEEISKAYGGDQSSTPQETKTLEEIRQNMAEPEEIEEKSIDEMAEIMEEAGGEVEDESESEEEEAEAQTQSTSATDTSGSGRAFIEKMADAGNRVISNDYGTPTVELIVPDDIVDETEALIEEWDINPAGPSVMGQSPSFADERPEIAEDLTGFDFVLERGDDLSSAGYDLEQIIEGLEGEPFLLTKSSRVEKSLPV